MTRDERLARCRDAVEKLLHGGSNGRLMLRSPADTDATIWYSLIDGRLDAELRLRPYKASGGIDAAQELSLLGFQFDGTRFCRLAIEPRPEIVAWLTEHVFTSVFRFPADFEVSGHVAGALPAIGTEGEMVLLSEELIVAYLQRYDLSYDHRSEGPFRVRRTYEPWLGRTVVAELAILGADRGVFHVRVVPDRVTPFDRVAEVVAACRDWNTLKAWPKATISGVHTEAGQEAVEVCTEASIDFVARVPEAVGDGHEIEGCGASTTRPRLRRQSCANGVNAAAELLALIGPATQVISGHHRKAITNRREGRITIQWSKHPVVSCQFAGAFDLGQRLRDVDTDKPIDYQIDHACQ